jgi:hypothetical protein
LKKATHYGYWRVNHADFRCGSVLDRLFSEQAISSLKSRSKAK